MSTVTNIYERANEIAANTLANKAVLARVSFSVWNPNKRDKHAGSRVAIAEGAQSSMARVYKSLVPDSMLKEINAAVRLARDDIHYRLTSPWQDDGYRILAGAMYPQHDKELLHARSEFNAAVRAFCERYTMEDIPQRASALLGGLWSAADYPSPAELTGRYSMGTHYRPMPSADDWRVQLSPEDRAAFHAEVADAQSAVISDLWERIRKACQRMADNCNSAQPRIHETMIEEIAHIAYELPKLNVTNDAALNAMAVEVGALLLPSGNVAAERVKLRDDDTARLARASDAERLARKAASILGVG